ncbi:MAG: hypothetical protein HQK50_03235 [Oligoflexia bacterium]|nr:hypothetical protein [Oligoflexia bacterium]
MQSSDNALMESIQRLDFQKVSYQTVSEYIFKPRCVACHGNARAIAS